MPLTGHREPLSDAIAPVLLREMPCEHHCVEGTQHLGEADLVRSLQQGPSNLEREVGRPVWFFPLCVWSLRSCSRWSINLESMNTPIGKDVLCLVRFVFREWAQYPVNQRVRSAPPLFIRRSVWSSLPTSLWTNDVKD